MKGTSRIIFTAMVMLTCCVSCKQDPELVEKRAKQKAEIARLSGELSDMQDKINQMPPDVTEQLTEVRKQAETQAAEVTRLEAEVAALTKRKRAVQEEFDAYRVKYQSK